MRHTARSLVNLTRSILALCSLAFRPSLPVGRTSMKVSSELCPRVSLVVRFLCVSEKLLLQPRKGFTRLMQPTSDPGRVSISPSLILHGRTEIKARALVLGEVSALSFCLLAILPANQPQRHKDTGSLKHLEVSCSLE